jgi:diguanylate cyclase (GGDEF)-like protein
VFAPPSQTSELLLFLCTCVAGGVVWGRGRLAGRLALDYPLTLAALFLFGAGGSLAAALTSSVAGKIARPRASARTALRHALLDASSSCLAAGTAAVAWLAIDALSPALAVVAVAAHAAVYLAARAGLARAALRSVAPRAAAPSLWRSVARQAPAHACGALFAAPVAWGFSSVADRPWIYALGLLALAWAIQRGRIARLRLELRHAARSRSFYESVTRALAKIMEAKDEGTQEHVRRVRDLSVQLGQRLGLCASELQALEAASLLHDIGKLGVPEAILSKPGRLSESEVRQIRLHPELGADILDAIGFPFPLAPIVRHHHERWDGTGYPDGLAELDIPLGARILAVVDTYDALTSDRPYRTALSPAEAAEFLEDEAGRAFDPLVVRTILDCVAACGSLEAPPPRVVAAHDDRPATEPGRRSLPRAEQELQTIYDVTHASDRGLRFEEYMSVVACKLTGLVPYRTLIVWLLDPEHGVLRPAFVLGHAERALRQARLALGERLTGWCALHHRAISGTRHVVPLDRDGSRADLEGWVAESDLDALGTTLAAPMMAADRCVGVLSLYDGRDRTFGDGDRRILVTIAAHVAEATCGAPAPAEHAAVRLTDPLTGVPNARFLRLELASRIALHDEPDPGFGLMAFRTRCLERVTEQVGHTAANRMLGQIARRLASSCEERETLVRFGPDLFLVLTPLVRPGALVERWRAIIADATDTPLDVAEGLTHRVTLDGAHAAFPAEGASVEALLESLETRLRDGSCAAGAVIPFRRPAARIGA